MPSRITSIEVNDDRQVVMRSLQYMRNELTDDQYWYLYDCALSVVYFRSIVDMRITDIHYYDEEDPHCIRPALAIFRTGRVAPNTTVRWSDFKLCDFRRVDS